MPKKLLQRPAFLPKHSAFADDSDEETTVGSRLQKEALKKKVMKQTKLEMQKALEQDATVYEYDSVYDDIQKKKEETSTAQMMAGKEKKPKYIQSLMQAVEVRKKEQEKRMEKKIQKEREAEGAEFEDKEAFVTSTYKKKLEERAQQEDQEKREAAIEASLDVTKQKDLSGFYRHLLNQTVGEEQAPECSLRDSSIKEEKSKGYSDEPISANPIHDEKNGLVKEDLVKKEEISDSDGHLASKDMEVGEKVDAPKESQELLKRKESRSSSPTSEEDSKGHRSQRHSRSSSEEKDSPQADRHSQRESKKSHKKEKGESGSSGKKERQHKDRDQERRDRGDQPDKERHRDKGERHRHSDHSNKGESRKRDEVEGKYRSKEKKEKSAKDRKRDKDRDDKHSEKERHRSNKDKGEKNKEREEQSKTEKKEQAEKERKKQDEQEGSPLLSRKEGELSGEGDQIKAKEPAQEEGMKAAPVQEINMMEEKIEEKQVDDTVIPGMCSDPEGLMELKRKETEDGEAVGSGQVGDAESNRSKFAKRSNEETVVSARDRYLARQMARVSTKSYIEKEED
ncbi:nuclear speckle splicing regulatory protein 1 isoform X2 [Lissotriton helveticus]